MTKRGLGKGLDSIFGSSVSRTVESRYRIPDDDEEDVIAVAEDAEAEPETTPVQTKKPETEAVKAKQETKTERSRKEDTELEETGALLIDIQLIQPNLNQPRRHFDEEELDELAASIKEYGILQPLLLKKQGPLYEIIAGERRWRAAKRAGLTEVPAIIRELDEKTSREIAIIENIQRADLNAVEEARAYQSLIDEYGLTQEEVAKRVSKKRVTITNSLRLLKLEPEILELLGSGKISQGHARALLGIDDSELRCAIARRCAEENLSVREIEQLVKLDKLKKAEKKKKDQGESDEEKRLKAIYRDLEKKMKAKLGTKVSIVPKDENKGKLEIEYYSQDELDRIFTLLNSLAGA